MRPFRELTRRSRLYRLRQMAKEALKVYGIEPARLSFIQYFENIIYRVDTPNHSSHTNKSSPFIPNRYVLRIHAMGDVEAIASELSWLAALSQDAGLSVPAPVSTLDGKLLTMVSTPGLLKGRTVSLMRWLDGRRIHHGLRPRHLTALGKAVAGLHTFSASWKPPSGFNRPTWDWDSQLGGSMFEYPMDELVDCMPGKYQQPFKVISREAKRVMADFGKGADVGTEDNPIFSGVYEYSALSAGATVLGAKMVAAGEVQVAFNLLGGFHHAGRDHAEGFCYINDIAIAINHLLKEGLQVAFVDIDAHHANGVQDAFYRDPRVFVISFHGTGKDLYPWSGFENEIGEGQGKGYTINVPLPQNTDDEAFMRAFSAIVPPLLEAYSPDLVIAELGADTHPERLCSHPIEIDELGRQARRR